MRNEIAQILLLQEDYSHANTPSMYDRGVLVRHTLPRVLRDALGKLARDGAIEDFEVEGNDGVGRKTEIPWTRVFSKSRSPHPTSGWYLVFLFSRNGSRAYLSLIQGTTSWDGLGFKRRPEAELASRSQWARDVLGLQSAPEGWTFELNLEGRRRGLGEGYELGSVVAREYAQGSVPADGGILDDLKDALDWLASLYKLEDEGLYVPGDAAPEFADVQAAVENIAGKEGGQGWRLSGVERLAIERRAVEEATLYFEELGYAVEDVGSRESYDLKVWGGGSHIFVEVKGTTSTGTDILLTRNEVLLHKERYPHNALVVVHSIHLERNGETPTAWGGTIRVQHPWQLVDAGLTPIAYRYSMPDSYD